MKFLATIAFTGAHLMHPYSGFRLMELDAAIDTCWEKCVLYQPAHMCQYACNQQETFVPPGLLQLKSLDTLVTDYGMEFDVDEWALMNLKTTLMAASTPPPMIPYETDMQIYERMVSPPDIVTKVFPPAMIKEHA